MGKILTISFILLNLVLFGVFAYLFFAKLNINDIAFIVLLGYMAVAIAMFVKLKRRSAMIRVR